MKDFQLGEFVIRRKGPKAFVCRFNPGRDTAIVLEEFAGKKDGVSAFDRAVKFVLSNFPASHFDWMKVNAHSRLTPLGLHRRFSSPSEALAWKAESGLKDTLVLVKVDITPVDVSFGEQSCLTK